jgi:hypothetical protein
MNQRSQYEDCFSNATLAPDWDLTEAIHASVQHLSTPPTYCHVLGHQDDDKEYSQLSFTAQLNVDADEAAGAFHWNHAPTLQATVPLLPTTKVQLPLSPATTNITSAKPPPPTTFSTNAVIFINGTPPPSKPLTYHSSAPPYEMLATFTNYFSNFFIKS